jgi:hypothetical protein
MSLQVLTSLTGSGDEQSVNVKHQVGLIIHPTGGDCPLLTTTSGATLTIPEDTLFHLAPGAGQVIILKPAVGVTVELMYT